MTEITFDEIDTDLVTPKYASEVATCGDLTFYFEVNNQTGEIVETDLFTALEVVEGVSNVFNFVAGVDPPQKALVGNTYTLKYYARYGDYTGTLLFERNIKVSTEVCDAKEMIWNGTVDEYGDPAEVISATAGLTSVYYF